MTGGANTGESESPERHVERLLAEGILTHDQVAAAEACWREYLTDDITMPNGERVGVSRDDLYHVIASDRRIAAKPWRIERILAHVIAIRTAKYGRRIAFSRWIEDGAPLTGYGILDATGSVRTMHIVREAEFRRLMRQGESLWGQ